MRYTLLILLTLLLLAPVSLTAKKKKTYLIVLDAGHGGNDFGTNSENFQEKEVNLRIVKDLEKLLKKNKAGVSVLLTRTNDTFVSLEQRCKIANNAGADLFVSVHVNYAEQRPLLIGTETFYANLRGSSGTVQRSALMNSVSKSELLAWLVQHQYHLAGRVTERGAKPFEYFVVMNTKMPAVLTEVGFASNLSERNFLRSDEGVRQIAICLYNAISEYLAVIQTGTEKTTLNRLRSTIGAESGVKASLLPIPSARPKTATPKPAATPAPVTQPQVIKQDPVNPASLAAQRTDAEFETMPTGVTGPPVVTDVVEPKGPDAVDENPAITYINTADSLNKNVNDAPVGPVVPAPVDDVKPASQETPQTPKDVTPATPEKKVEEAPQPAAPVAPGKPVFRIQLFSVSNPVKNGDVRLKGLAPVECVQVGAVYKVLYTSLPDYRQASNILASIRDRFPDAFIVAFLGDKQISTAEALKM